MIKELLAMKMNEFKLIKFFINDLFYRLITLNIFLFVIDILAALALTLGFIIITPLNLVLSIFGQLFLSKEKKR